MNRRPQTRIPSWLVLPLLAILYGALPLTAQTAPAAPRLTQAIDATQLVPLRGNVHPLARAANDRGAAPADMTLSRMLLLLKRSPAQETALRQLIQEQQMPSAPQYHQWLTPAQFGAQFGPAPADIQTVSQWLESQGFHVDRVAPGGGIIEFSGNVGQVAAALHTQIHRYVVNGESHWANSTDPEIPAALAPVVGGVVSLNNFLKRGGRVRGQGAGVKAAPGQPTPSLTFTDSNNEVEHAIVPGDFSLLYNVAPLYASNINGTGQTIAIVGRTDVNPADISAFRSLFVPTNPGNVPTVIHNGPDPGIVSGDETESDLDLEWSGAIAPNATVDFVVSASTDTTDGIDLSAEYIVTNNLAPVMSTSYDACEAELGTDEDEFIESVYEQAAAQGITVIDSAGDSGAADCDPNNGSEATATQGQGVSGLASTPFSTGVGGTEFNENGGTYWSSTNSNANYASALGPIPEAAWNESCNNTSTCDLDAPFSASGGGASLVYTKPSWQTGITGMPNDGARDVPDVSFTAAGHDGYVICEADIQSSCVPDNGGGFGFAVIAGTSASAPSFAGVMALVNQETSAIQGLANYTLYNLALHQENWSACNTATAAVPSSSSCIFLDTTVGNNSVPGVTGFTAGVGYDQVTGLGSMNVANLVNAWTKGTAATASKTTLALSPTNTTHGQGVNLTINVTQASGAIGPTGDVVLIAQTGDNGTGVDFATLTLGGSCGTSGCVTGTENGLPAGSYPVVARYSGDANFAPSVSNAVNVTVSPEGSVSEVGVYEIDQDGNEDAVASAYYGDFMYVDAFVEGEAGYQNSAGCSAGSAVCINDGEPTGTVTFTNNGVAYAPLGTLALNTEGEASFPNGVSNLIPGTYSLGGNYSGDTSFLASTAPAVGLSVAARPTITTLGQPTVNGTSLQLTAAITTYESLGNPPTGAVNFFSGTTQIGTATVTGAVDPNTGISSATASTTVSGAPTGQDSITAQFIPADTNYVGSTSTAIGVTIGAAGGGFTLGVSPPSQTVNPGTSAVYALTLTPNGGFSGNVALTCTGAPAGSQCTFSPATVALAGPGNGTSSMTVTTSTSSMAPGAPGISRPRSGPWVMATALLALWLAGWWAIAERRRGWRLALPAVVAMMALAAVGCGGGSSSGSTATATNYTLTVTATSGTVVSSQQVGLTVE